MIIIMIKMIMMIAKRYLQVVTHSREASGQAELALRKYNKTLHHLPDLIPE